VSRALKTFQWYVIQIGIGGSGLEAYNSVNERWVSTDVGELDPADELARFFPFLRFGLRNLDKVRFQFGPKTIDDWRASKRATGA
jgi:hypothetical protein